MEIREISAATMARLIQRLSNSSASGMDEIDSIVIKLAAVPLLQPITFLINLSILTQTFPNKWKIGRISPLYKGKNLPKHHPGSYRPITLLPVISKLAERAVQEQVVDYMNQNSFFHPNQHSYRKGYSTTSALLQLSDQLFEAADRKEIGAALSVDQTSAFDCICLKILNDKMKIYGFGENTLKWVQSYLNFRSQYIKIGTKMSGMKPVMRGVPQGSVLGPILFIIYVNEMPESTKNFACDDEIHSSGEYLFEPNFLKCGIMTSYADDSTYVVSSRERRVNQRKQTDNLENIKIFLKSNKLCVNEGKTVLLETMNKQKRCKSKGSPPSLMMLDENNVLIENEAGLHCRLLGANISRDLTWRPHLVTGEKPLLPNLRKHP